MHEDNCFITLTYDDYKLTDDYDGGLHKDHFQKFMKRLRKRFSNAKIRYFLCGEYGSQRQRPHYHALLFGFDFNDKEFYKDTGAGYLYTSKILNELWGYGNCLIGDVTVSSASYVAGYIIKKQFGRDNIKDYVDLSTGLLKEKEYVTMSRRPGIGRDFFLDFKNDIYPKDFIVIGGVKYKPPRFYDNMLDDVALRQIKSSRVDNAKKFLDNSTQQ